MIEELLISGTPFGLRAAAIAESGVRALFVEAAARPSRIGDIYHARRTRVISGLDAAFYDVATENFAYLEKARAAGDSALVQVTRDAHGEKGARLTTRTALAGRYLVLRPQGGAVSVSPRIGDADEQRRLAEVVVALVRDGEALTVRSAAAGVDETFLQDEAARLHVRWDALKSAHQAALAPTCLYRRGGLLSHLLLDVAPRQVRCIRIDAPNVFARAQRLVAEEIPDLAGKLALFDEPGALFDLRDAAGALEAALEPVVPLPSGAKLTIEPTVALTAIDVDTGARAGAGREATLSAICRQAARHAAHHIVLRNLSGLIVVDFPQLAAAADRAALVAEMTDALADDHTPHSVLGLSRAGLMEITRRRHGEPLLGALTERSGDGLYGGRVPRIDAVAFDIAEAAAREVRTGARGLLVSAAPPVIRCLTQLGNGAGEKRARSLSEWLGVRVEFETDGEAPRAHWHVDTI